METLEQMIGRTTDEHIDPYRAEELPTEDENNDGTTNRS